MQEENNSGTADEAGAQSQENTDASDDLGMTQGNEGTPGAVSNTFLTDGELMDKIRSTPELDHMFRKMQSAYSKRSQDIAKVRDAAQIVERFNSDPEFARQTILSRAQQLGLHVGTPGQTPGFQHGAASKSMPPELVEAVKANLSPELQWMAPALAASQWAGMQLAMQPIVEQQAQASRSTRDQQYDTLVAQLSEKAPGWEAHEEDMDSLLAFMQSQNMTDRRWGSKLELLHRLAAGSGQATAEAARRMGAAAKARTSVGSPVAAPAFNIAEQVRKPKHTQDAWDIAAKHAVAELARQGIKVA